MGIIKFEYYNSLQLLLKIIKCCQWSEFVCILHPNMILSVITLNKYLISLFYLFQPNLIDDQIITFFNCTLIYISLTKYIFLALHNPNKL